MEESIGNKEYLPPPRTEENTVNKNHSPLRVEEFAESCRRDQSPPRTQDIAGKSRAPASNLLPDILLQPSPAANGQHLPQDLATLRTELRLDLQVMLDAQKEFLIELFAGAHAQQHHHHELHASQNHLAARAAIPSGYEELEDSASAQGDGASEQAEERSLEESAICAEASAADQSVSAEKARLLGSDAHPTPLDKTTPLHEEPKRAQASPCGEAPSADQIAPAEKARLHGPDADSTPAHGVVPLKEVPAAKALQLGDSASAEESVQCRQVRPAEQASVAKMEVVEEPALAEEASPAELCTFSSEFTVVEAAPKVIGEVSSLMSKEGRCDRQMSKERRHELKRQLFRTLNHVNAKATFCEPHTPLGAPTDTNTDNGETADRASGMSVLRSPRDSAWKNDDQEFKIDGAFDFNKKQAFADLGEEEYDVANFYWEEGVAQKVARSEWFQNTTLAVISANAVYIGVDADWNKAENPGDIAAPFLICENFFCVFFLTELIVRFAAFKRKRDCLKDGWFKFDSVLVMLMLFETWLVPVILLMLGGGFSLPTAPLRMLRLLRLSRMTRLMRSLPELVTMVKGMKVASRAVGSSLLMLAMLIYVFAIIVHMLLKEEVSVVQYFETVPRCMWTLLMDGALMDSTGAVLTTLIDLATFNTGLSVFVFMLFTLLSAMTVMNMLIGVLCEVVSAVAASEKDEASIRLMKSTILLELKHFDEDGNGCISQEELQHVLDDKHAIGVLRSLQVDVGYLRELQSMLFPDLSAEVSIESIMDLILMCRGDLSPTVKHMINGQAFTRWMIAHALQVQHQLVEDRFDALADLIEKIKRMQMVAMQVSNGQRMVCNVSQTDSV